eukprot:TRINITY_DN1274_c7_g1_i2.p1 TRINITY_DN1274_c7_g1~~TRINITY_DN1274_c7_g1_i2.p1  ORF type:complete len:189 (-),score=60.48 TRINITY_DN1274_c7_g1_i2:129-695(-)
MLLCAGKDLALQTLRAELERSNRQKRDAVERANELEDLLEKVHRGMVEKVQPAIDEQVEILSTELAMMRKRSILSSSEGQTDVQNIAQGRPQKQVKKPHRGSKEYVSRNSLLVEMLKIDHFKTIKNIFVAALLVFGVNLIVENWMERGELVDLTLFFWIFSKFNRFVEAWFVRNRTIVFIRETIGARG